MAILSDGAENRRDSIALAFRDAKITCLEFDDAIHGLRTRYAHWFLSFIVTDKYLVTEAVASRLPYIAEQKNLLKKCSFGTWKTLQPQEQ
jgi:hypothetical protein